MGDAGLRDWLRSIESVVLSAPNMSGVGGLYEKMEPYAGRGWVTLRSPVEVDGMMVVVLVRVAGDEDE